MIKKIAIILGLTLVAFVAFYFFISIFIASQIVKPNHEPIKVSADTISPDYQNVTIKTKEGILYGWLFKGSTNKLIIMDAGFRENRINQGYYGSLIAKELIGLGYNVLLFDNQATGQSYGNYITFGVKESRDLINVVNFVKAKGFEAKNIGIIGDSMGAISLLLASDRLNDVGAMVVDSAAKNIKQTAENILQNENNIPPLFNAGTFFVLRVFYHLDFDKIQPAAHVKLVPQRVFLYLHGELDTSIYPTESKALWAISNPQSKLVYFPNGKHIETYKSDPSLYRKLVFTFLQESLGR